MNSLSIFIWLTQICAGVHSALTPIMCIETIAFVIISIIALLIAGEGSSDDVAYAGTLWKKSCKWYAWTFIPFLILYTIVPSQQTMVLIASSEIGQRVVTSQEFQDNVKGVIDPSAELLKTWIRSETAKLKDGIENKK